jgi:hypothetical protein
MIDVKVRAFVEAVVERSWTRRNEVVMDIGEPECP